MKLMILSQPRSGSSYLLSVFQHNYAASVVFAEPFSDDNVIDSSYVNNIIEKCNNNNFIIKTHISQLSEIESRDYFLYNDWHKIILLRKNLYKQAVSFALARTLNVFDFTGKFFLPIKVDTTMFLKSCELLVNEWNTFVNWKENMTNYKITYYEDLTFKPTKDIKKLGFPINIQKYNNQILPTPPLVKNQKILKEVFNEYMLSVKLDSRIKNNNGILELV